MSEAGEAYKTTFDDIRAYCSQRIEAYERKYQKIISADPEGAHDCEQDIAIFEAISKLSDEVERLAKCIEGLIDE